ncbi:MAG: glycosyltransferase family 2 protein [bacterium]|nr:glycosyltransferase family 2 protein [bacterium]
MKIFCVIPAYNEAENIVKVIEQVKPLVNEVVVVDDGSTDQTGALAEQAGAKVLRHIINCGQGAALRTGNEYSLINGAGIIVHFDADGQFSSRDIRQVIAPIINGSAQVVYGSRFLNKPGNLEMPFLKKRLLMPLARMANRVFYKINLTDPQSGFRAMSAFAAKKVCWGQDRMAHCSEIMIEVKKNNLSAAEVPITVIYRRFGQSFSGGLKIIRDLLLAKFIN